jgi:hypothetical protein
MRKLILAILLACVAAAAQVRPAATGGDNGETLSETRLPVRRVVLYKNGVGYFEHSGRVRGTQQVTIDFTTSQLNDVLKSLTVLDLGKGHITGVSYNSTAPLDQRLRALRLPLGQQPTTEEFLTAIRGSRVEVRSGSATVAGRLLSVETQERKLKDDSSITVTTISIVTDAGEMRAFEIGPATSVRVLERDLQDDVNRYLKLLATTREQEERRMTISAAGTGDRELLVSYISEVPVWKSTYRIVLPEKDGAKAILQGWAVVDNTVGEDWENVQLSLVAGAPQSFIQQLSQPYYTRRPVVPLPTSVMLEPQTHEATMDTFAPRIEGVVGGVPGGQTRGVIGGIVSSAPAATSFGVGSGVGSGSGGGIGGGNFSVHKEITEAERESVEVAAAGQDLGDLFEYKLSQPITIHKNQSALVPILQSDIDAEPISLWNSRAGHVLRALWMTNSSSLTLDGGSFNVIADGNFAGEGLLDPVKPGERRLVSYAVDLGMRVETKNQFDHERVSRVRVAKGVLMQTIETRERRVYTVRNDDSMPRALVVEHELRPGWKLFQAALVDSKGATLSEVKPDETTASFYRFRVSVAPHDTALLAVNEYQPSARTYQLSNLRSQDVDYLVQQKSVDPELERALRNVLTQKNNLAALEQQIKDQRQQITSISDDQQRLRENLKALKGSPEEKQLVQRYTRELNEQEDRVEALRKAIASLELQRAEAQRGFDQMLEALAFDNFGERVGGGQ